MRDQLLLAALRRIRERRSVLLGYHGIADVSVRDDLSLLQVSPARFSAQIDLLDAAGFKFLTVAQLASMADGGVPDPGFAAITFDDGMRNNLTTALPILAARGIPATVYVTVGFMGGVNPWMGDKEAGAMLTQPHLQALVNAGWEIGAHTLSHPDMATLDYAACLHEISSSRMQLEEMTGARVQTFAYPFGRYGPAALAAVRDAEMLAAITTGSGVWGRYEMTRAMIGAADPWPILLLKLTDRYEPLLRTAPMRAARAASKRLRGRLREQRTTSQQQT
jgi:peptidoglycan/xylan/chitin deacetylase (PgdA/CDA1 family)